MGDCPDNWDKKHQDHLFNQSKLARWHPLFTDIVNKENDKKEGMFKILDYYKFNIDSSMAFGDGGNDISILKAAGIGVAMGNASEEVKTAADYVTTSVDDDGIANALRHFALLKE